MTYSYQVLSSVRRVRERSELLLGTSGGRRFFRRGLAGRGRLSRGV